MEAGASTFQHTFGQGPHCPNPPPGAQQVPGPHQLTPGPYGGPGPNEQQPQRYNKPFFYIQPYLPTQSLQWPMPVPLSFSPYCGYPGLSYGMPVMPHFQQSPYVEPPSYVMPQTHLHLMDYRRMLNPQYYQTMAYRSRRFHYQHHSPEREMISSEMQTEPLLTTQTSSPLTASGGEASSGLPVRSDKGSGTNGPARQPLPPTLALRKVDRSANHLYMERPSTIRASQKSSFVIQTEEVSIECCSTPVGLEWTDSRETAELAHTYSQDMARCTSMVNESPLLQEMVEHAPTEQSDNGCQVCPDILLVGTPSCGNTEKILFPSESKAQSDHAAADSGSRVEVRSQVQRMTVEQEQKCNKDVDVNKCSKNVHFKVLHLPFDLNYLDELRGMESTVWSMDETSVPSTDWLIKNSIMESRIETLDAEAFVDELMVSEELPIEQVVPMIEMPPLEDDPMEALVPRPTVKSTVVDTSSASKETTLIEVCVAEGTYPAEVTPSSSSQRVDSPLHGAEIHQRSLEVNDLNHPETSFESLPAYLSPTNWLADLGNVYHCGKVSQTPQKQSQPRSGHASESTIRERKLNAECKELRAFLKPKTERCKTKIKVDRCSLSDHECCFNRNLSENTLTPPGSRGERLCNRCLAKRSICAAVRPELDSRIRKRSVPLQPWDSPLLWTCEACKSHSKKPQSRQCSSSEIRGHFPQDYTEGETSENSFCWTGEKGRDPRRLGGPKRTQASGRHSDKCPVALCPKLREKNCACEERWPTGTEGLHWRPRSKVTQEMNEENLIVPPLFQERQRNMERRYLGHNWQTEHTERPWKAAAAFNPDSVSKNERISQHLNKQKKSQPLSQGTHRKDTRC